MMNCRKLVGKRKFFYVSEEAQKEIIFRRKCCDDILEIVDYANKVIKGGKKK